MYWLNHILHVLLPAFVLASLVTVWARWWQWRKKQWLSFTWHWISLFVSGAMVSLISLVWQQRDGTMLSYVVLILVVGSMQTLLAAKTIQE